MVHRTAGAGAESLHPERTARASAVPRRGEVPAWLRPGWMWSGTRPWPGARRPSGDVAR